MDSNWSSKNITSVISILFIIELQMDLQIKKACQTKKIYRHHFFGDPIHITDGDLYIVNDKSCNFFKLSGTFRGT